MNKQIKHTILSALAICFFACEPDVEIPGQELVDEFSAIYLPKAEGGVKNHTIRIQPEPEEFVFRAAFGGLGYPSKDIGVSVQANPSLAEEYNVNNGTAYPVLPEDAFSLSDKVIIPSGALSSSKIQLSINSQAMEPFTEYILAVEIKEVSGEIAINEDLRVVYLVLKAEPNVIYMPLAEGGLKNYTMNISPEPEKFLFGAAYGGIGFPSNDVEVTFQVDPLLVEEYNAENGTTYPALPEEAFTLSGTNAKISVDDTLSSEIMLSVNSQIMEPFTEYMLPVKIKGVSDETAINEDLRVAYLIFKTEPNLEDYEQIDRAGWSVVDFSSEEPAEGANGGLVSSAFDGADNTFWHTQWNGGEAPPPHWFIIDMGSTQILHALTFLTRQSDNAGKPHEVQIETSLDGSEWSQAGEFTLENVNELQTRFLSEGFNKEARYLKVTVISSHQDANYTHLAEFYAY